MIVLKNQRINTPKSLKLKMRTRKIMIKIRRKISQKIMGRQSSALSKRIFKNM
jgi:hypothetical protein